MKVSLVVVVDPTVVVVVAPVVVPVVVAPVVVVVPNKPCKVRSNKWLRVLGSCSLKLILLLL